MDNKPNTPHIDAPLIEEKEPSIIEVKSLADLQKFCDDPIQILITFGKHTFSIQGRRLRPNEDATLDDIRHSVLPPSIKGAKPEDDRFNYNDPNFVKNKAIVDIESRALGLYWCIPIFSQERGGLTERKQIAEFVQTKFTAQILDVMWQAIRNGGVTAAQLVNFTSPNTSTTP